ncbi:MAG: tetratricopeptide repeat protein, partial [Verrucomicrobiae bacterium]|nr:tetratricopeptide repeat protein [Verrucomicrobiae bacterium]
MWSLAAVLAILVHRRQIPAAWILAAFAIIPVSHLVAHWAENEQRDHRFGFWFGHDMFTPPFGIYPEMTYNAILFGGTDPGRFCPTYMIFCESFIKPSQRFDPSFDRRDVYIITQNALADATYLNYIRAHYNRSAQIDPPFFRDFVLFLQNIAMGRKEAENRLAGKPYRMNAIAKFIGSLTNVVRPLDNLIMDFGRRVEERRRREGVYPPKEIITPTPEDSQQCFAEYIADAQRRLLHDTQFPNEPKQIRPGEIVNFTPDGRVQVAGQVAVMTINGLLTKVIFDKNPTNEFFVEESFPLEWMYPYLTPYGIIMKLNRNPVPEITEEIVQKDHEFWTKYSERLCGNWITYDTPIKEICAFADRVYRKGDLTGYKGDPKFVRDNDAQKAFSKLRNAIAGLYAWRINSARSAEERSRLIREADFAFKQAFAFCPYSPETVTRYASLLVTLGRLDDALMIAETAHRLDEESPYAQSIIDQLRAAKQAGLAPVQSKSRLEEIERRYQANTNSIEVAFELVSAHLQLQQTAEAFQILDDLAQRTNADAGTLLSVANAYVQLGQYARAEPALRRLAAMVPDSPEIWYDLAGAQVARGETNNALRSL